MVKKVISLVLSLLMVMSLAACGGSSNTTTATTKAAEGGETTTSGGGDTTTAAGSGEETTIHVATEADPATFTPYGANKGRQNFFRNIYETLGRLTQDLELDLVLAKEWTEVEPGVYDVTIYDYITDRDGNHMTASDVVFSFDTFKQESADQTAVSSLKSYEATDEYTIRFTFENPNAGAFETAMDGVRIVTQAAWEAAGDGMAERPCGTAPYYLAEYKAGEYGLLKKRDDYWQTDESLIGYTSSAFVDNIYLDIITDYGTQALALLSGDLDLSQYITTTDMGNFVNDDVTAKDGYTISTALTARQYIMVFNCSENSQCSDINLRKAIACCIDKASVAKQAFGITAVYPETVIYQYYKDYDESFKTDYSYDIEQAKKYLADSSYNGEAIKMITYADFNSQAALMIQDACRQAGIELEIVSTTQAEYTSLSGDTTGTQFDIDLTAPSCPAGYAWSAMSIFDENHYDTGVSHIYVKDSKLQEAYEAMASAETNSKETVGAFAEYVDDQCYAIGLGSNRKIVVGGSKIASIMQDSYASTVLGGTQLK